MSLVSQVLYWQNFACQFAKMSYLWNLTAMNVFMLTRTFHFSRYKVYHLSDDMFMPSSQLVRNSKLQVTWLLCFPFNQNAKFLFRLERFHTHTEQSNRKYFYWKRTHDPNVKLPVYTLNTMIDAYGSAFTWSWKSKQNLHDLATHIFLKFWVMCSV